MAHEYTKMTRNSRTAIQIETHEIKIIRFVSTPATAFCQQCMEWVAAITPEQAARVLDISLTEVDRLLTDESFHRIRHGPHICGRSLKH